MQRSPSRSLRFHRRLRRPGNRQGDQTHHAPAHHRGPDSLHAYDLRLQRAEDVPGLRPGQTQLHQPRRSAPHTVYYQIYVDGALIIDNSAGKEIAMGSTLAKTEFPYQVNPADATLTVTVYFWADDTTHVRLDDHRVRAGFGLSPSRPSPRPSSRRMPRASSPPSPPPAAPGPGP